MAAEGEYFEHLHWNIDLIVERGVKNVTFLILFETRKEKQMLLDLPYLSVPEGNGELQ